MLKQSWADPGEESIDDYQYWDDTLFVIGNHDVWLNANYNMASQAQLYAKFFSHASSAGMIMAPNTTYWKKVYSEKNIMLIGLNCMLINSAEQEAQMTFLNTALEEALNNNYRVIIAYHWCLNVPLTSLNSTFKTADVTKFYNGISHSELKNQTQAFENALLAKIDEFISRGGLFACWLTGHSHTDDIGYYNGTHNQVFINLTSLRWLSYEDYGTYTHGYNYTDWVAFNIVQITKDNTIKVNRYGGRIGMSGSNLFSCELNFNGQIIEDTINLTRE